ncbi:uncharacterized protein LOC108196040 isoform X2 [Daucus carota subsp. sativus]|uniref:uncharacterized protein LOC108196040 isoform X2 n=1 Tax=Daucus carota subsp. sativus TaxID=79200 RepID=UPI0030836135
MASKNKRKKAKNKNQNNLQGESKPHCLPPKQDHIIKTETEKLFERVKAKVEALKAAISTNAGSIPFHDTSASTPEKAESLEKKIENGGPDDLHDLPNVSERAEVTADTDPLLVSDKVQNLANIKVPQPVSNSGSDPKILKRENDDNTGLKPKKKMKKKASNIKIQTLLKQSDDSSPIVGLGPASIDPVKESSAQELPECEVPQPVSNSGSNPRIFSSKNEGSTVLKPKKVTMKKKKKKTTNIKIETLLENSSNISPIVGCDPSSFNPVKESLDQDLPDCEVPQPVSNSGSIPKILNCENNTTNIKMQTLLEQSANTSTVVGCGPASIDPVKESLVQDLPECEVPQPVSTSGCDPRISKCENDDSTVLKPNQKTTDIKIQKNIEQSATASPVVAFGRGIFDPVEESLVQELPECEVPQPVSTSGCDPRISKCENDDSTVLKPNQKTTDNKIQTNIEQSATTSPVVAFGRGIFDPVEESVVQELPECEVPQPVSDSGSDPKILSCENDNSSVLKPKKKTTDTEIQTYPEHSANTSSIVGFGPDRFDPVKESLVQELPECENIKLESLRKNRDPVSKKDLEKSIDSIPEEVKVNIVAHKAAENMNAPNIPFYDMSASTPDKAYPLEKIIEKEEWDCLGDLLNIPRGAKLSPEAYPSFVRNRVHKLEKIQDEHEKRTVASVLQYITHLIKYKDKHLSGCYNKFVKDHKFPSIIEEKFQAMFSESSSEALPPAKRELLVNYVLVLSLFVDGYKSNAKDITKDLKIKTETAIKYYKQLGCIPRPTTAGLLVELPVPLKFPVPETSSTAN